MLVGRLADHENVTPAVVERAVRIGRCLILNGILWILCSGVAWRDLPERFGPWSTVYQQFRDWRDDGTFDQVIERLHIRLNQEGLIDLDT